MGDKPSTERVKASDARQNWSRLLKKVNAGEARLIVEKDGIPVAGIVSANDLERFNMLEAERERNFSVIDDLREAFSDIPDDELEEAIQQALAEVRAERRPPNHR